MPEDDGETYTVTITFSVGSAPDEHLQNEQSIRDEVQSWLASLDATVHAVEVRPAKEER